MTSLKIVYQNVLMYQCRINVFILNRKREIIYPVFGYICQSIFLQVYGHALILGDIFCFAFCFHLKKRFVQNNNKNSHLI